MLPSYSLIDVGKRNTVVLVAAKHGDDFVLRHPQHDEALAQYTAARNGTRQVVPKTDSFFRINVGPRVQ